MTARALFQSGGHEARKIVIFRNDGAAKLARTLHVDLVRRVQKILVRSRDHVHLPTAQASHDILALEVPVEDELKKSARTQA